MMTSLLVAILSIFVANPPAATVAAPTNDLSPGFWMPEQASTVAGEIDFVFDFITWLSIFFFIAIVAVMGYFCWKYRRRPDVVQGKAPIHNTPLELAWTILPLFLVIAIFYVGLRGFVKLQEAPAGAYEVEVTAQKWFWTFRHPNGVVTDELDVPVGQPVKLVMKSTDVLHSLYIPAFRVKRDVIPGRYSALWFEAIEPGVYDLACTEYCGTSHSTMISRVNVYEQPDFEQVLLEKGRWFDGLSNAQLAYQAAERLYPRCASCHSLDGSRITGPSFTETHENFTNGTPRLMESGAEVAVDENYIRESILVPQAHVVATYQGVMPTFKGQLKEEEVDALVLLIKNLPDVVDAEGNLKDPPPAETTGEEAETESNGAENTSA